MLITIPTGKGGITLEATLKTNSRNLSLECCKLLAACFVVFLHIPFPGAFGQFLVCLSRFAVPLFFAVSGWFSYGASPKKLGKRFGHILLLEILGDLLYVTWRCARDFLAGESLIWCLRYQIPDVQALRMWLFWSVDPFAGHLWYLSATCLCYGVLWLYTCTGRKNYRPAYLAGIVLLLASFATMLNHNTSYHTQLLKNFGLMLALALLFYVGIYHFVVGSLTALDPEPGRAERFMENMIYSDGTGFIAFNVFVDLFLCTLFLFFLCYRPKKFFQGKSVILLRLCAVLPVAYELACEKTLPASDTLAKINDRDVPANSIILIGALACLYSIFGNFDLLTDLGVFSCWVFYTLTFACVIHLRHTHPEWERTYKVPGYPVVPILAIISGLYVIASQLFMSGTGALLMSLASVAITLVGLPVYLAVRAHATK
jgi:amino acid transporter